jgi:ABC-type transporter lipoprotein component MlaA
MLSFGSGFPSQQQPYPKTLASWLVLIVPGSYIMLPGMKPSAQYFVDRIQLGTVWSFLFHDTRLKFDDRVFG